MARTSAWSECSGEGQGLGLDPSVVTGRPIDGLTRVGREDSGETVALGQGEFQAGHRAEIPTGEVPNLPYWSAGPYN